MTDKPIFVRQTTEPETPREREAWMRAQVADAKEAGATWFRFSNDPKNTRKIMVEGWKERPKDEGPVVFDRQNGEWI